MCVRDLRARHTRISGMRKLVLLGLALAFLSVSSETAGGEPWLRYEQRGVGLAVSYPPGWRPIDHALTSCSDPAEVIDLGGPGRALFMLQESSGRELSKRPASFRLEGPPHPIGCCSALDEPGWVLSFRDGGRDFYAYLYPGRDDRRAQLLRILNSLEVRP